MVNESVPAARNVPFRSTFRCLQTALCSPLGVPGFGFAKATAERASATAIITRSAVLNRMAESSAGSPGTTSPERGSRRRSYSLFTTSGGSRSGGAHPRGRPAPNEGRGAGLTASLQHRRGRLAGGPSCASAEHRCLLDLDRGAGLFQLPLDRVGLVLRHAL